MLRKAPHMALMGDFGVGLQLGRSSDAAEDGRCDHLQLV